jgi:pteridine reductase
MDHDSSPSKGAALVTGGAVRLGKAIAITLATLGFDIALHYNSSYAEAAKTQQEILDLGRVCQLFQQDLSKAEELEHFMAAVASAMPDLAILVNSAAYYERSTIANTSLELFDKQFSLNLRTPFFLTQHFANQVAEGQIINICDSKIAFNQYPYAAYLLAKKSLAEFTYMAAAEFAPRIRVNGVAPGVVMPPTNQDPDYVKWRFEGIPLKRQGDLKNITQAVKMLVENDYITGHIIFVDGGEAITNVGRNAGHYDWEGTPKG